VAGGPGPAGGRARRRRTALAACAVALVTSWTASSAAALPRTVPAAAPPAAAPAAAPPAVSAAALPAATTRARDRAPGVRAYWTRARMAAAVPAERLAPPPGTRFERRGALAGYLRQVVAARGTTARPVDTGSPWSRGGLLTRTTGKVFFTLADTDYVCSGSAVTSADRSTVLTAGHCVYDPQDRVWARNWMFVPGYASGTAPYGLFVADHLATTTGWRATGDFDDDVALVDVGPRGDGRLLTDAVGSQRIGFDVPRGRPAVAVGYPAEAPWDGETLIGCSGPLRQDRRADPSFTPTTDQGMACTMTGGSSGGPWLTDVDLRSGRGTVTSVTSFGYTDQPGVLWGPYLGSVARAMYDQVAGTATG